MNKKVVQAEFVIGDNPLLFWVDKFLKEMSIDAGVISGLAVRVGSGSFTSTRMAVTTANALAYALNIPVVAVGPDENWPNQNIGERIACAHPGQYVLATYSGAPNIGKKK